MVLIVILAVRTKTADFKCPKSSVISSDAFWKALEEPLSPLLQKFQSVVKSRGKLLIRRLQR
jgi:hypothetical protein